MEEIKSNQRVSNIFTAHMLAGIAAGLNQAHAGALIRRFSQWEEDWQDCTRLLREVEPALHWLPAWTVTSRSHSV
jgi:hypothetical protein